MALLPQQYTNPEIQWQSKSYPEVKQKTPAEILSQLMTQLTYRGVGFNNHTMFFAELANNLSVKSTFPPYDILSNEENKYEIRMALAGFKKTDLEITFQNQVLTVKTKALEDDADTDAYFHKGIAARAFTQTFPLAEYVNIISAEMEDGILTIKLERELPEELKPRTIKIKQTSSDRFATVQGPATRGALLFYLQICVTLIVSNLDEHEESHARSVN